MSETKSTPGPWVTEASTKTGNLRFIRAEDGTLVADVFHLISTRETTTANAHLIAASPDYDHAARALVARHDALASEYDGTTRCECQDCALFRPIIARADGR